MQFCATASAIVICFFLFRVVFVILRVHLCFSNAKISDFFDYPHKRPARISLLFLVVRCVSLVFCSFCWIAFFIQVVCGVWPSLSSDIPTTVEFLFRFRDWLEARGCSVLPGISFIHGQSRPSRFKWKFPVSTLRKRCQVFYARGSDMTFLFMKQIITSYICVLVLVGLAVSVLIWFNDHHQLQTSCSVSTITAHIVSWSVGWLWRARGFGVMGPTRTRWGFPSILQSAEQIFRLYKRGDL